MSLFARVRSRAGLPGGAPLARMKGFGPARDEEAAPEGEDEAMPLRRQDRPEREGTPEPSAPDEEASPLRRRTDVPEEDELQPLRRAVATPDDEPQARPLRRLAEDVPSEEARALRRAGAPDDETEELRPQRRALAAPTGEEGEKEPAATPLRRRAALRAPDAQTLEAETSPKPDLMPEDPGPSPAMALRRLTPLSRPTLAMPPAPPGPPGQSAAPEVAADTLSDQPSHPAAPGKAAAEPPDAASSADAVTAVSSWPFDARDQARDFPIAVPPRASAERPRVVIEQVDVIIHEPPPARSGGLDAAALSRALRSRYLQG
jgi:hypothetical protein